MVKYNTDLIKLKKITKLAEANQEKFVKQSEGRYVKSIQKAVNKIVRNIAKKRIVLVTGPSASGKTTTSNILMEKLSKKGIKSVVVSMDNFFINRELTPKLEDGSYDYENITAIDVEYFKKCIDKLLLNGKTMFPKYNFAKGERDNNGGEITIDKNSVIIIEGIHAFNPAIVSQTMQGKFYRLYVCVNSGYVDETHLITAKQLRFTRRLVRDFLNRGASVKQTEEMWDNVLRGENLFIKPYKKEADIIINTTHAYEVFLYDDELREIAKKDSDALKYYEMFKTGVNFDKSKISKDALIWEFLSDK